MAEITYNPGDFKINEIVLFNGHHKLDISNIVLRIMFHENVFNSFITGSIQITDTSSIIEEFPLMGEEFIMLDIETPFAANDNPEAFRRINTFHVYKLDSRENVSEKNVMYTLRIISSEGFFDINEKISGTFKGSISELVPKFLKTDLGYKTSKEVSVEETANSVIYTSNFWTPSQNLYYLASQAINKNKKENFVFFENREGFMFGSLDTMASAEVDRIFHDGSTYRTGTEQENLEIEQTKILDFSVPSLYDYIDRQQQGMYGSSLYHYDVENKNINFIQRVAINDWEHTPMNSQDCISDTAINFSANGNVFNKAIHRNLYNASPNTQSDHDIKLMSDMKRMFALKVNISVFGRFDYTAGATVFLYINKNKNIEIQNTDEESYDKYLSGKYLISSITHDITIDRHLTYMELVKDSFEY